jgi:hypothetical protein
MNSDVANFRIMLINVRENRTGNHELTTEKHWQHIPLHRVTLHQGIREAVRVTVDRYGKVNGDAVNL